MMQITEKLLQTFGLRYLDRYAPSISQYRHVLQRKVKRVLKEHGGDKDKAMELVELEIQKRIKQGILNDQNYANSWVNHLHEKGKSKLQIIQKLMQKGVAKHIIDKEIEVISGQQQQKQAAIAYARKRRLGPFNPNPQKRKEKRQKEIASMMRVGHPYDITKTIIDAQNEEELFNFGDE